MPRHNPYTIRISDEAHAALIEAFARASKELASIAEIWEHMNKAAQAAAKYNKQNRRMAWKQDYVNS